MSLRLALAVAAVAVPLSGCAYDMYGDPYGYGYGPYGGISAGYYGGYGYAPYGYGYRYGGYEPFGWYGDYYYPGMGIYVYDSGRHRHVWNDAQRNYWTNRTMNWRHHSGAGVRTENWSGFHRDRSRTRDDTTHSWRHHPD